MWLVKYKLEYACIERLILNTSWKNYKDLGKPKELRY